MSSKTKKLTIIDAFHLFVKDATDELYGTKERAMNTIGVAFMTLVILRIGGYIGEAQPMLGAACGG